MTNEADRDPHEERQPDGTYRPMTPREELERIVAIALIDADPTMSGHHQTHIDVKLQYARAAIDAIYEARKVPTPEMLENASPAAQHQLLVKAFWQAMFPLALGRDSQSYQGTMSAPYRP